MDSELEEMVDEIREYAGIEGTEVGEVCKFLLAVLEYESYVTEEFYASLVKEIKVQLENFKENSVIIKEERTHKETIRYIEWKF
jgi:hypothetical protein